MAIRMGGVHQACQVCIRLSSFTHTCSQLREFVAGCAKAKKNASIGLDCNKWYAFAFRLPMICDKHKAADILRSKQIQIGVAMVLRSICAHFCGKDWRLRRPTPAWGRACNTSRAMPSSCSSSWGCARRAR